MRCHICNRRTEKQQSLCKYHLAAKQNIENEFERWRYALDITWEGYLERIESLTETGRWVKEVIQYLRAENVT